MNRLEDFLITLSDMELAQFYNYRFHQFIPSSKERILDELLERDMDPKNLGQYINDNFLKETRLSEGAYCARCYSTKLYNAEEKETLEYQYDIIKVDAYYKTCLVCLNSPEKPKNYERHRLVSLFDFIRGLRKKRR